MIEDHRYNREVSKFSILTNDTHDIVVLGQVGDKKIYLFEAKKPNGVLITAGWQGDEPAGWEACKVLCKEVPECSFIPFVSPDCVGTRQHWNRAGKNVDRDYPNPSSEEGKVLIQNIDTLLRLGKSCMLSLQEDPHRPFGYIYSWNADPQVKAMAKNEMRGYFHLWEDGLKTPPTKGMFGDYFVKQGCKMAIQLETPADGTQSLASRTACQVDCCKVILALI